MIMRFIRFALLVVIALASTPALAVQPDELMKDPALEARARALSSGLRCLVCQNQTSLAARIIEQALLNRTALGTSESERGAAPSVEKARTPHDM